MIINDIKLCTDELISNKFAYKYFQDKVLRMGNIITFISPVEKYSLSNCINFLYQIPDINIMTGICFQRLFNSIVANILSNEKYLNCNIQVDGERLIVNKEYKFNGIIMQQGEVSINNISYKNDSIIGYLGLYNEQNNLLNAIYYQMNLNNDQIIRLQKDIISEFYGLLQSINISCSKV